MLVIGLMSGTSADGIDAALVEWPDTQVATPFRLVAHAHLAHPALLQQRIHTLAAGGVPGPDVLREVASLDVELGERFAEAALAAAKAAGLTIDRVDGVASHGQTIAHHPEHRASLQIGDPSVIAERTGRTTIADFRPRDLALGGEGAPLAPFFHWAALSGDNENRVALNLGGIANISWLPRTGDPDSVVAFDTGPANSLIDGVISLASEGREAMDLDGARAARGRVDDLLLHKLMDDEYLAKPPPKSTGRERYGTAEARSLLAKSRSVERALDDLVATLVAFTAESIGRACRELLPREDPAAQQIDRLIIGGGGAHNPVLVEAISCALPAVAVDRFDDHGVPAQAAEAMAFSLMGRNALLGVPNHLPRCTGASRAAVLGEITPGHPRPTA
ncbi:MAG: anhydro-N-acetylmuramic acid kinase [Myxococcota bacterium]|jgi:anhydro-N-acetylmuramic acid kinase|nr:anhydro-N-acetylmuramic acid kinase [Myxococcota bacterium]